MQPPPHENESVTANNVRPGVILAIEDNSEDVELLRMILARGSMPFDLISVPFAKDAIKYLGNIGEYADRSRFPRPVLIVLDLSLLGMGGMEFLTWARCEADIPPIVILTYSRRSEDRDLSARLGAKGYFVKSLDLKETAGMVESLRALVIPPIPLDATGANGTSQELQ